MAMGAGNSTHSRDRWNRRAGGVWCKINDSFAAGPWAGNSLRSCFTDQQTIARTAHIFLPRWSIPDRL